MSTDRYRPKLDQEKQKAVIHHIVMAWSQGDRKGIRLETLKYVLFLIDMEAYRELGQSITGATYRRRKTGIGVDGIGRSIRELRAEGRVG